MGGEGDRSRRNLRSGSENFEVDLPYSSCDTDILHNERYPSPLIFEVDPVVRAISTMIFSLEAKIHALADQDRLHESPSFENILPEIV
jgi:hypothetical protein